MAFLRLSLRRVLCILLAGALGLGVLACGNGQETEGVTVVNPRLVRTPDGNRAFTGTLVNQRSNTISIAQVEVALYDDRGTPVETVRIEVERIPAQDSVDFSGKIDSDRAFSQAQVQSILTP
jgi:hypothetical protein